MSMLINNNVRKRNKKDHRNVVQHEKTKKNTFFIKLFIGNFTKEKQHENVIPM